MGADTFFNTVTGKTANEAFKNIVADAQYEHGHGGYTGTIAEKGSFVMINLPKGQDAREYANKLIDDCDPRVDDKWGPAGCIEVKKGEFLFFGWASS
jgi:hypothetical protein